MINPLCRLALVAILIVSVVAPPGRADDYTAAITAVERIVMKKTGNDSDWHTGFVGTKLNSDDAVQTGDESKAELAFPDGTHIRLAENSTLTFQQKESRIMQLLTGKLWVSARKGVRQQVSTPSVVATVVGTEFLVEINGDQASQVTVLEGTVEMTGQKQGDKVMVTAGHMCRAGRNQALTQPVAVDVNSVRNREKFLLDRNFGEAMVHTQAPVRQPEARQLTKAQRRAQAKLARATRRAQARQRRLRNAGQPTQQSPRGANSRNPGRQAQRTLQNRGRRRLTQRPGQVPASARPGAPAGH